MAAAWPPARACSHAACSCAACDLALLFAAGKRVQRPRQTLDGTVGRGATDRQAPSDGGSSRAWADTREVLRRRDVGARDQTDERAAWRWRRDRRARSSRCAASAVPATPPAATRPQPPGPSPRAAPAAQRAHPGHVSRCRRASTTRLGPAIPATYARITLRRLSQNVPVARRARSARRPPSSRARARAGTRGWSRPDSARSRGCAIEEEPQLDDLLLARGKLGEDLLDACTVHRRSTCSTAATPAIIGQGVSLAKRHRAPPTGTLAFVQAPCSARSA